MYRYPEGRRHMFSLLMLALPGIDANDFRKTIVSPPYCEACINFCISIMLDIWTLNLLPGIPGPPS